MPAGTYNIVIEQGATFTLSLVWRAADSTPIDLTGYTARMQVRQKHSSPDPALSLTSEAGDIVLGGTAGTIVITAPASATSLLTFRTGVYDIEMVLGPVVTRLLEGSVTVTPEVTR